MTSLYLHFTKKWAVAPWVLSLLIGARGAGERRGGASEGARAGVDYVLVGGLAVASPCRRCVRGTRE